MVLARCTLSNVDWYLHEVFEDILNRFQVTEWTQFCDKVQREITQKVYMQELWFLCSACHLMLINIYMKFREDSLNGFPSYRADMFCDRVQGK